MKNARLLLILIIVSQLTSLHSFAQQWNTSGANISNSNSGNVGIGTTNAATKLEIKSPNRQIRITDSDDGKYWQLSASSEAFAFRFQEDQPDEKLAFYLNNSGNVGIGNAAPIYKLDIEGFGARVKNSSTVNNSYSTIRVQGPSYQHGLELAFFGNNNITNDIAWSYGGGAGSAAIMNVNPKPLILGTNNLARLFIDGSGNVSIGDTNSHGYKFAVAGTAIVEEIDIRLKAAWPDFVFETKYNLPSLFEVEKFIKQNHRLPEVPSAQDVKEQGIHVGEMNALLLKKIEELTLYMIEFKKEMDGLKQENNELRKQLSK